MERCYLPTKVVPIYLLTFVHAFERLGWQEQGQATGAPSIVWIRSYDCCSSDLAAQRLLRFNLKRHHVPLFLKNHNVCLIVFKCEFFMVF